MSSLIHWRFKNEKKYDPRKSIPFDGPALSLEQVHIQILAKLGKGANGRVSAEDLAAGRGKKTRGDDYRLFFKNANTGEDYVSPQHLIPKNTVLIIRRVFASSKLAADAASLAMQEEKALQEREEVKRKAAREAEMDKDFVDDDEEARKMQQAMQAMEAKEKAIKKPSVNMMRGPALVDSRPDVPPPYGYLCKLCSQPGHYIRHCPTKKGLAPPPPTATTSTPPSMVSDRPNVAPPPHYLCKICRIPGHFIAHCPTKQYSQYGAAKSNRNLKPVEEPTSAPKTCAADIPHHLACGKCNGLMNLATTTECCYKSFCHDCIRLAMFAEGECPICGTQNGDEFVRRENMGLRKMVDEWKSRHRFLPTSPPSLEQVEEKKSSPSSSPSPPFSPPPTSPRRQPQPKPQSQAQSIYVPPRPHKRPFQDMPVLSSILVCGKCGGEGHMSVQCPKRFHMMPSHFSPSLPRRDTFDSDAISLTM